jgi:hypothetical protein
MNDCPSIEAGCGTKEQEEGHNNVDLLAFIHHRLPSAA